jgi:hypothetical protein
MCEGCDKHFQHECLQLQSLPSSGWYCPGCTLQTTAGAPPPKRARTRAEAGGSLEAVAAASDAPRQRAKCNESAVEGRALYGAHLERAEEETEESGREGEMDERRPSEESQGRQEESTRCAASTHDGTRCVSLALPGERLCKQQHSIQTAASVRILFSCELQRARRVHMSTARQNVMARRVVDQSATGSWA